MIFFFLIKHVIRFRTVIYTDICVTIVHTYIYEIFFFSKQISMNVLERNITAHNCVIIQKVPFIAAVRKGFIWTQMEKVVWVSIMKYALNIV